MRHHLNKLKNKFVLSFDFLVTYKKYYLAFLGILLFLSLYHIFYASRLIPGVMIAGEKLGGLTYSQAIKKLEEKDRLQDKSVTVSHTDKVYELQSSNLKLVYDWEATVNRAFEVGRTGNIYRDTKDKLAGLFKPLTIRAYYDFNEDSFNKFLSIIKGDINVQAQNAKYELTSDNSLLIANEFQGRIVDEERLYTDLISRFDDFKFEKVSLVVKDDAPQVIKSELETRKKEAEQIVFNPLKIVYEDKEWEISPEQKLEFLSYDPVNDELAFNKVTFKSFLDNITPLVNKLPKGKVTSMQDGKVASFELIQDGISLNEDSTLEAFKDSYFGLVSTADVKINTISGPVDPTEYGIFALLGEGKSKFTGSAAGRVKNLTLAASRTDGVLVPPGSIYSFNDSVGEISAATGYDAAWVILGNRTVLGHGGGVCQVSTTMFRAILNSGLPVITRHPHAYRVKYYEIESQLGMDASVYQPSLDLEFKNDTPNFLLVESSWDLSESSLTFKIYGTPDGRKVDISDSVVTNQSAPPEPLYQDDPSLPKGTVRQIDFPAWGANVSFTRTVTRGDELLYDDVFKTSYQPWRAIYLVGTKE